MFSNAGLSIWPLFGTANQLLAALALLTISVWLARKGESNVFVRWPMYFMFLVTLSSLVLLIWHSATSGNRIMALLAGALFLLALVLAREAWTSLHGASAKHGEVPLPSAAAYPPGEAQGARVTSSPPGGHRSASSANRRQGEEVD